MTDIDDIQSISDIDDFLGNDVDDDLGDLTDFLEKECGTTEQPQTKVQERQSMDDVLKAMEEKDIHDKGVRQATSYGKDEYPRSETIIEFPELPNQKFKVTQGRNLFVLIT